MIQGKIVTPQAPYVEPMTQQTYQQAPQNTNPTLDDMAGMMSQMFNAVGDEVSSQGTEEANEASSIFKKIGSYFNSANFKKDIEKTAMEYHIPPKQLAKNFFLKIFGIVGDILGIVVNTACSVAHTIATIFNSLLHSAIDVVGKVANTIVSVVTLNQTVTNPY